ncbi:single-stranded DNA-binding protein [Brachybacterium alimentarium]|uniref:single-stranded DNA-binding protein n=1 Tax=Brachybacterium alimentarium TaxID=47845 RepID=UPI000DF18FFF|nr:single-stranded DNA-binding protein [Brachybacterium alimentarium]RCS81832.1 single-stranded DNA-binding protein [Brachybacterium alimentarium]
MANDTLITVVGNLTADPELRFTQAGIAVANFTIASTPRRFDKQRNEYVDEEALFLRSTIWRDAAENVAESLEKGSRVVAQGNLVQRAFTDRDGNNRTSYELNVVEIGPSLKYATAKPNKVQRNQQGGGFGGGAPQGQQGGYGGAPQGGYGQPAQGGGYGPPQSNAPTGGYDDPPF